jgi:lactoylglutathione lyase
MRIEHLALWTQRLETLKAFYANYFGATAGPKYVNAAKQFESYFLSFASGARLELMQRPGLAPGPGDPALGLAHFAVSVGSTEAVDALTARLHADGYRVLDGPRRTGDGYYESVVLDPDGNRVEITV